MSEGKTVAVEMQLLLYLELDMAVECIFQAMSIGRTEENWISNHLYKIVEVDMSPFHTSFIPMFVSDT